PVCRRGTGQATIPRIRGGPSDLRAGTLRGQAWAGEVCAMGEPRVILLGGLGRSGTTLVERIVGELPGVMALGEIVHLWRRDIRDNERCGCGERFHDCPFWS